MHPLLPAAVVGSATAVITAVAYEIFVLSPGKSLDSTPFRDQIPCAATLRHSTTKEPLCTGIVVGKRHILIASSCVNGLEIPEFEAIVEPRHSRARAPPRQRNVYEVAKVVLLPDYNHMSHDVAMVYIDRDIHE